ncbi:MAG: CreA family protein [Desulfobacterales bacterium]|nr:CreA family protein [Desulfobacterales bacterium]
MKKIVTGIIIGVLVILTGIGWWIFSRPERGTTGEVSTNFRWLGPNDKIVVDGFDDPKVQGVACHISRAQTGGVKGAMGVAEDTSHASIACRQVGPIRIVGEIKDRERVFDEHRSLVFKTLQVVRFFDREPASAMFWSMWPTATGFWRAARRTASARCRSWAGRHPDVTAS